MTFEKHSNRTQLFSNFVRTLRNPSTRLLHRPHGHQFSNSIFLQVPNCPGKSLASTCELM